MEPNSDIVKMDTTISNKKWIPPQIRKSKKGPVKMVRSTTGKDPRQILGKSVDLLDRVRTPHPSSVRDTRVTQSVMSEPMENVTQLPHIESKPRKRTIKFTYEVVLAAKQMRNIPIEQPDQIIARLKLQVNCVLI